LSLLFSLEKQRQDFLTAAQEHAARREWQRALSLVKRAESLRSDADIRRLCAVLHLLTHEFSWAWRDYISLRGAREANQSGTEAPR
jgi:hypothetical protein